MMRRDCGIVLKLRVKRRMHSMWRVWCAVASAVVAQTTPGHFLFMPTQYSQTSLWGSVSVLVHRGLGADGPASVLASSRDGSALQSVHYVPIVNHTLRWADGDAYPVEVFVQFVPQSTNLEKDVSFFLDLHDASSSVFAPHATAAITIQAINVFPGEVAFASNTMSTKIPATWDPQTPFPLSIPVHRLKGAFGHVQVPYDAVVGTGTALTGRDYNFVQVLPFSRFLTWSENDKDPKNIELLWLNQDVYRQNLTFTLQLSAPTGQALLGGINAITVTVEGNDLGVPAGVLQLKAPCFPTCPAEAYTVEAASAVRIYVERQKGSMGAVSVTYSCKSLIPGQPQTGTLAWVDGDSVEKSFVLVTSGTSPTNTAHQVTLSSPTNGAKLNANAASTAVIVTPRDQFAGGVVDFVSFTNEEQLLQLTTVQSDMQLMPELDYWDSRIGLPKPVQVTAPGSLSLLVQRSRGSAGVATVCVQTIDGTAKGGVDFVAQTTVLQWPSGDTRPIEVKMTILAPPYTELDSSRTFSVILTSPSNVRIGAFYELPLVIRGAMQTPRLVTSVLDMTAKTLALTFSHPISSAKGALVSILNPDTKAKITLTSNSVVVQLSPAVVQLQLGAQDFVRLQQAPNIATSIATSALSFDPGFADYDNLQCKSTDVRGCFQPLMLPQAPILVTTFIADSVRPTLVRFTFDQQYVQLQFSKVMDRSSFQWMQLCSSLTATACVLLSPPSRLIPRGEVTTTTLPFPVDETLWIIGLSPQDMEQLSARGIGPTRATTFIFLPAGLRDVQGNVYQGATVVQAATSDCSACPAGTYRSRVCTDMADRVCMACSVCGSDHYAATPCSATSNTKCHRCHQCHYNQYASTPCTPLQNRKCTACTRCTDDQYEYSACTTEADRVCLTCDSCVLTSLQEQQCKKSAAFERRKRSPYGCPAVNAYPTEEARLQRAKANLCGAGRCSCTGNGVGNANPNGFSFPNDPRCSGPSNYGILL
ncbi:hypothetical protein, variant [Aphanomyces invadans]|uniref:TNFR-Cys domain-containing protein n=1 Tax=Aphanomyces invadans TaxID=157072 RepID=A0A024TQ56_9STRA|nr:hypothetical protein, variant [Aphanomyces invadans]ETV96168.1 hypothetical protein, variant [Aphanomyces invadans]|eukprot:XP_008874960.1 hypothetical protein, variant [Aphanomyces invadans]